MGGMYVSLGGVPPGAQVPFGNVRLSPDTSLEGTEMGGVGWLRACEWRRVYRIEESLNFRCVEDRSAGSPHAQSFLYFECFLNFACNSFTHSLETSWRLLLL